MKIAIAGYGTEGRVNYHYFSGQGHDMTIVDERETFDDAPGGVRTILGPQAFERLNGFDMVIRTAGLAPRKIMTDGKIWSATNEFFEKCPAPIIGVTGSKGKGTTASLIASILQAAGKTAWLVGNIGLPGLEVLSQVSPDDIVVYELSSFQLWDVERSPHVAVVLFIEQEHLDVHASMEEYVNAKANITAFQEPDDVLIYNETNSYSLSIAGRSKATKIGYPQARSAHVQEDAFYYGEQYICSTSNLKIPGTHNLDNACAAIDAAWQYVQDIGAIEQGLQAFTGLPHRLHFVRTVAEVDYYDDSIATTPSSAIAALRAFDKPKVIILGGSYKGSDFTELAKELTRHNVQAILIGDEAHRIARACDEVHFDEYQILEEPTMAMIVHAAQGVAKPGSVVLMSPAAASFGLFKNYADRGEQFVAAVEAI